ncbi:MAG: site-2 protease family protein [Terriglobia bacterium]
MALQDLGRGFNLPRILGIEIRIDYSWFIIFGLLVWMLAHRWYPQTFPGQWSGTYWGMGLVSALLLFASVLVHELSHAVVARRYGLPVPRITLFIFGGVAQLGHEPLTPRAELFIAGIGPITSIVLGTLFLTLREAINGTNSIVSHTLFYLGVVNLVLAAFNLLPGFPLDGGRVLRAWLWQRWANLHRATRVAASIGRLTGFGLIGLGLVEIIFLRALVGGIWMILIGLFLRQAATSSYQMTALEDMLHGIRVAEIMHERPVSVAEDLPLDRLVEEFFYRYRFTSFPVERDTQLAGLVHMNQVKEIPRAQWPLRRVAEVMSPRAAIPVATPEQPVAEAFRQMTLAGKHKLPVTEHGRLVGIVTVRDILQLFRIRSDLLD